MVANEEDHALVTIRLLAMGIVQTSRIVAEGVSLVNQSSISFWNANRSKSAISLRRFYK